MRPSKSAKKGYFAKVSLCNLIEIYCIMNFERRNNIRLKPGEVTFVAMRPEFFKLGKLRDISSNGLSFNYLAAGLSSKEDNNKCSLDVDIFTSSNMYYLSGIPCKIIYDNEINKKTPSLVDLEYRQCGLQFIKLSGKFISRLNFFLSRHAVNSLNKNFMPFVNQQAV